MDGSEYGYTAQEGRLVAEHFATMRDYLNVGFPHELHSEDVADVMTSDIRFVEDIPPPLDMFQLNGVYSKDPSCVMNAGVTGPREPQFLGPTYDVRLDDSYALSETYLYYGNRYRLKSGKFPTPGQFFSPDFTLLRNWMHPNPNLLFEPETDVVPQKMRLNNVYQESQKRYSSHPALKYCSDRVMDSIEEYIDDIDDDLFILHFQGCHVFGFHKFVIRNTYRCIVNIMTGSSYPADAFKGVAGWTLDVRQIYIYETAFTLHLCETLLSHPERILPQQILPVTFPMRPREESVSSGSGSSNGSSGSGRSGRSQEEEEDIKPDLDTLDSQPEKVADRFDAGQFSSYSSHAVFSNNMNEVNPLPDKFLEDSPPKNNSNNRGSPTGLENPLRNTSIDDRRNNFNQPENSPQTSYENSANKEPETLVDNSDTNASDRHEKEHGFKDQQQEQVTFAVPKAPVDWGSLARRTNNPGGRTGGGSLGFLASKNRPAVVENKPASGALAFLANRNRPSAVEAKPTSGSLDFLTNRNSPPVVEEKPVSKDLGFLANRNRQLDNKPATDPFALLANRSRPAVVNKPVGGSLGFLANRNRSAEVGDKKVTGTLAFLANRHRPTIVKAVSVAAPSTEPLDSVPNESQPTAAEDKKTTRALDFLANRNPLEEESVAAPSAEPIPSPATRSRAVVEDKKTSGSVSFLDKRHHSFVIEDESEPGPSTEQVESLPSRRQPIAVEEKKTVATLGFLANRNRQDKNEVAKPTGSLAFLANRYRPPAVEDETVATSSTGPLDVLSNQNSPLVVDNDSAVEPVDSLENEREESVVEEDEPVVSPSPVQPNESSDEEDEEESDEESNMSSMEDLRNVHVPQRTTHGKVSFFQGMVQRKKEHPNASVPAPVYAPVKKPNLASFIAKQEEKKKNPANNALAPSWASGLKGATVKLKKKDETKDNNILQALLVQVKKKTQPGVKIKSFIGNMKDPGESSEDSRTASPVIFNRPDESPMEAYFRTSGRDQQPSSSTSRDQSPIVPPTPAPSRDSSYDSVRSSTRTSQWSGTPSRAASRERSNSITASPISARMIPSPIPPKTRVESPLGRFGDLRKPQPSPFLPTREEVPDSAPTSSREAPMQTTEEPIPSVSSVSTVLPKDVQERTVHPQHTEDQYSQLEETMRGMHIQTNEKAGMSKEDKQHPEQSTGYVDLPGPFDIRAESPEEYVEDTETSDGRNDSKPECSYNPFEKRKPSVNNSNQHQSSSMDVEQPTTSQHSATQPRQNTIPSRQQQPTVIKYSPLPKTKTEVQAKSAAVSSTTPVANSSQTTPLPSESLDAYRKRMQLNGKLQITPASMSTSSPTIIVASELAENGRVPVYAPARSDKPVYYLIKRPQLPVPTVVRNPARPGARGGRAAPTPTAAKNTAQQPVFPVSAAHVVRHIPAVSSTSDGDIPVVVGRTWGRKMKPVVEIKTEQAEPMSTEFTSLPVQQYSPVLPKTSQQKVKAPRVVRRRQATQRARQPRRTSVKRSPSDPANDVDDRKASTSDEHPTKSDEREPSVVDIKLSAESYKKLVAEHSYADFNDHGYTNRKMPVRANPLAVVMEGIVLDTPPEEGKKHPVKPEMRSISPDRERSPTPVRIGPKRGRPYKGQEIQWTPAVAPVEPERKPRTRTRNNPDAPAVDTVGITHERKPKTKKVKLETTDYCIKKINRIPLVPLKRGRGRPRKIIRPRGKKGALMRRIATALEHEYHWKHGKKSPRDLQKIPDDEMPELLRQAVKHQVSRGEFALLTRPVPIGLLDRTDPRWIRGMVVILRHVVRKKRILKQKMTPRRFDEVIDMLSHEELCQFQKRLHNVTAAYQEDMKRREEAGRPSNETVIIRTATIDSISRLSDETGNKNMCLEEMVVNKSSSDKTMPFVCGTALVEAQCDQKNMSEPEKSEDDLAAIKLELDETNSEIGPEPLPIGEAEVPEKKKRGRPKKVVKPRGRKAALMKMAGSSAATPTHDNLESTVTESDQPISLDVKEVVAEPVVEAEAEPHVNEIDQPAALDTEPEVVEPLAETEVSAKEIEAPVVDNAPELVEAADKVEDNTVANLQKPEPAQNAAPEKRKPGRPKKKVRGRKAALEKAAALSIDEPSEPAAPLTNSICAQAEYVEDILASCHSGLLVKNKPEEEIVAEDKPEEEINDVPESTAPSDNGKETSTTIATEEESEKVQIETCPEPCEEQIIDSSTPNVYDIDDDIMLSEGSYLAAPTADTTGLDSEKVYIESGPEQCVEETVESSMPNIYDEFDNGYVYSEGLDPVAPGSDAEDQSDTVMARRDSEEVYVEACPESCVEETVESSQLDTSDDDVIILSEGMEPTESCITIGQAPLDGEYSDESDTDEERFIDEGKRNDVITPQAVANFSDSDDDIQIIEPETTSQVRPAPVPAYVLEKVKSPELVCLDDSDEEDDADEKEEAETKQVEQLFDEDEEFDEVPTINNEVSEILESCSGLSQPPIAVKILDEDEEEEFDKAPIEGLDPLHWNMFPDLQSIASMAEMTNSGSHRLFDNLFVATSEGAAPPKDVDEEEEFDDASNIEGPSFDALLSELKTNTSFTEMTNPASHRFFGNLAVATREVGQPAKIMDTEDEFDDIPTLEAQPLDQAFGNLLPGMLFDTCFTEVTNPGSHRFFDTLAAATSVYEPSIVADVIAEPGEEEENFDKERNISEGAPLIGDIYDDLPKVKDAKECEDNAKQTAQSHDLEHITYEKGPATSLNVLSIVAPEGGVEKRTDVVEETEEPMKREEPEKPRTTATEEENDQEQIYDKAFNRVFGGIIKYVDDIDEPVDIRPPTPVFTEYPEQTTVISQPNQHQAAQLVVQTFVVTKTKRQFHSETSLNVHFEKNNLVCQGTGRTVFERVQRKTAAALFHDASTCATFTFTAEEPTDNVYFPYPIKPKAAAQISLEIHESSSAFAFVKPAQIQEECTTMPCNADLVKVERHFGDARTSLEASFTNRDAHATADAYKTQSCNTDTKRVKACFGDAKISVEVSFIRADAHAEAVISAGRWKEQTSLHIVNLAKGLLRKTQADSASHTVFIPNTTKSLPLAISGLAAVLTAKADRTNACSHDVDIPNNCKADPLSITTAIATFESKPQMETAQHIEKLKNHAHIGDSIAVSHASVSLVARPQMNSWEHTVTLKNEETAHGSFTDKKFTFQKNGSHESTMRCLPSCNESKVSDNIALAIVNSYHQKKEPKEDAEHTWEISNNTTPATMALTTAQVYLTKHHVEETATLTIIDQRQKTTANHSLKQVKQVKTSITDEEIEELFGTSPKQLHIERSIDRPATPLKNQEELTVVAGDQAASPGLISPGVPRTPNFALSNPSSTHSYRPDDEDLLTDAGPLSPESYRLSIPVPKFEICREDKPTTQLATKIQERSKRQMHQERRKEERFKEELRKEEQRKEEKRREEERKAKQKKDQERVHEDVKKAEWRRAEQLREERRKEAQRMEQKKKAEAAKAELMKEEERRKRMEKQKEAQRLKEEKKALRLAKANALRHQKEKKEETFVNTAPQMPTHSFMAAFNTMGDFVPLTRKRKLDNKKSVETPTIKKDRSKISEEKDQIPEKGQKEKRHQHHQHQKKEESASNRVPEKERQVQPIATEESHAEPTASRPRHLLEKSSEVQQTNHVSSMPKRDSPTKESSPSDENQPSPPLKLRLGVSLKDGVRTYSIKDTPAEEEVGISSSIPEELSTAEQVEELEKVDSEDRQHGGLLITAPANQSDNEELETTDDEDYQSETSSITTCAEDWRVEEVVKEDHHSILGVIGDVEKKESCLPTEVQEEVDKLVEITHEDQQQVTAPVDEVAELKQPCSNLAAGSVDARQTPSVIGDILKFAASLDLTDELQHLHSATEAPEVKGKLNVAQVSTDDLYQSINTQAVADELKQPSLMPNAPAGTNEQITPQGVIGDQQQGVSTPYMIDEFDRLSEEMQKNKSLSDAIEDNNEDDDWNIFSKQGKLRQTSEMGPSPKRQRLDDSPSLFSTTDDNNYPFELNFGEENSFGRDPFVDSASAVAEQPSTGLATTDYASPMQTPEACAMMEEPGNESHRFVTEATQQTSSFESGEAFSSEGKANLLNTNDGGNQNPDILQEACRLAEVEPDTVTSSQLLVSSQFNHSSPQLGPALGRLNAMGGTLPQKQSHSNDGSNSMFPNQPPRSYEETIEPTSLPLMQTTPPSAGSVPNYGSLPPRNWQPPMDMNTFHPRREETSFQNLQQTHPTGPEFAQQQNISPKAPHMQQMNQGPISWKMNSEAQTTPLKHADMYQTRMPPRPANMTAMHHPGMNQGHAYGLGGAQQQPGLPSAMHLAQNSVPMHVTRQMMPQQQQQVLTPPVSNVSPTAMPQAMMYNNTFPTTSHQQNQMVQHPGKIAVHLQQHHERTATQPYAATPGRQPKATRGRRKAVQPTPTPHQTAAAYAGSMYHHSPGGVAQQTSPGTHVTPSPVAYLPNYMNYANTQFMRKPMAVPNMMPSVMNTTDTNTANNFCLPSTNQWPHNRMNISQGNMAAGNQIPPDYYPDPYNQSRCPPENPAQQYQLPAYPGYTSMQPPMHNSDMTMPQQAPPSYRPVAGMGLMQQPPQNQQHWLPPYDHQNLMQQPHQPHLQQQQSHQMIQQQPIQQQLMQEQTIQHGQIPQQQMHYPHVQQQEDSMAHYHPQQQSMYSNHPASQMGYHQQYPTFAPQAPMVRQPEQHWQATIQAPASSSMAVSNPYLKIESDPKEWMRKRAQEWLGISRETHCEQILQELARSAIPSEKHMEHINWFLEEVHLVHDEHTRSALLKQLMDKQGLHDIALRNQDTRSFDERLKDFLQEVFSMVCSNFPENQMMDNLVGEIANIAKFNSSRERRVHIGTFDLSVGVMEQHLSAMTFPLPGDAEHANMPSRNNVLKLMSVTEAHQDGKKTVEWRNTDQRNIPERDLELMKRPIYTDIRQVFDETRQNFKCLTVSQNSVDKVTVIHVEVCAKPSAADKYVDGVRQLPVLCCYDYFVQSVNIHLNVGTFECLRIGPMQAPSTFAEGKQPVHIEHNWDGNNQFTSGASIYEIKEGWSWLRIWKCGELPVNYLLWSPTLCQGLNNPTVSIQPPYDPAYGNGNQGNFHNGPGPSNSFGPGNFSGTFGQSTSGFSRSNNGYNEGYQRMNRLSTLCQEDSQFLIYMNPEMTPLYPTIVLRCFIAIENPLGNNWEFLDVFNSVENSIFEMKTKFNDIIKELRPEDGFKLVRVASRSVCQVWKSSWTVCLLDMARKMFTPTNCVSFKEMDQSFITGAMKEFENNISSLFGKEKVDRLVKQLAKKIKGMPKEVKHRLIAGKACDILSQTFVPSMLLQRLKTKPLWDSGARPSFATKFATDKYNLTVNETVLDDVFHQGITNNQTEETLLYWIKRMRDQSQKATHRRNLKKATKTSFLYEETFHSSRLYEVEARGVLRDLRSTPAMDPTAIIKRQELDALPQYVATLLLSRYITQRCEWFTSETATSANKTMEMANELMKKLIKQGIVRRQEEKQLVFITDPSNYGVAYNSVCVGEEIEEECMDSPPPAQERNKKRPASCATLPSIPAKSSRSEDSLTKPRTMVAPSTMLSEENPPAPSTVSTRSSVGKKLDYAESTVTVDSGFSSAPSIAISCDDAPTSTARLAAEDNKTIAPLVIQSDLDFVLPKLNNTPMNSPSADSVESVRTRKMNKYRSTISPMRLNTRLMDLKLLAEAADVVEGRSRSSSIDREGSSQPEAKIPEKLPKLPARLLPKKHIVHNVVSDGTHKYSVRIDYFTGIAHIDRKLTVLRTKKLRPEDEPAPIIAHLYNEGKREVQLVLTDGKPDWHKMESLAFKPPLTPMTPILPGKHSSRSQSPTEPERQTTSTVPKRLFRKPFLMTELIPEEDTSKEGSPVNSDSGSSMLERPGPSATPREQSVTSTITITSTESRQLDSDDDIEMLDQADSDVEEDKLQIVTDEEESDIDASPELNDYYYEDKKHDDMPLDLSMPKVIEADPVTGHPQIKVESRIDSPYQKEWEILNWDTPGCSSSPSASWEDLTKLKISSDDTPAPEDLSAKSSEPPVTQLEKLTVKETPFQQEEIKIQKTKTITPKLKAKKPKYLTPCKPKDKYIRRKSTRFHEILTEDEPPEIATDLTQHFDNMDAVRSAVEAAEKERKRMFTTVACDAAFRRRETRDRSRRLVAPKIAKRSKSADRWLGRTIYKHFGEFWVLGLARVAQPTVGRPPKKNQFEQVSRCNSPATIAPWNEDYQNCINEEEVTPIQKLVFPVHESFKQAEQGSSRNPATVWKPYQLDTNEDSDNTKPSGPRFFRNRRKRHH